MNQLIDGILRKFRSEQDLEETPDVEAFEQLATWCILARTIPSSSSLEDLMAGNDTVGIDALALFANNSLILDSADAEDVCQTEKSIDVEFNFIQAKTSEKFDTSEILAFGNAVSDFFSATPGLVESPFIKELRAAKDLLYRNSHLFRNRRPIVRLFYVTTGSLSNDINIKQATRSNQTRLEATELFEEVTVSLLGAAEIHRAFNRARNRQEVTVNFGRRVALPKIEGVTEAYIGVISAPQFLRLIEDDDDSILGSVFYDNVRDFQDMNAVNSGILATLRDPSEMKLFPVLNNGVTVVAQGVRPVGDEVTIEDYQVVNGCQTSHVLHEARDSLTDDVLIPLRLVVTEHDQVASQITKATNRQTPVDEGNLQALTDFQKELETFYVGQQSKCRLYYERRSRQYSGQQVEQTRVISPLIQMRAFAAMVLDEPHTASRYYRRLYERVPSEIFHRGHRYEPYYMAALAWYRLDAALRRKALDPSLRPMRYHVLMMAKYLAVDGGKPLALSNARTTVQFCDSMNSQLLDETASGDLFKAAGRLVSEVGGAGLTRDTAKRERFTRELLEAVADGSIRTSTN